MPVRPTRRTPIPHPVDACLALVLAGGSAMAQPAPAPPVARTFSDWSLTCDNLRSCVAMSADEDAGGLVMISRAAGPGAAPTVEVVGGLLRVRGHGADAAAVRYPAPAWSADTTGPGDAEILRTSDLAAAQAFIDAVRNADALHAQADAAGEASVSLKGISAALLRMDEVQGRLDTRGALLRRGTAPDSKVPSAPALPSLTHARAPQPLDTAAAAAIAAAVRRAQRDELESQDCDADVQDEAWPLTDTQALVYLGCWSGAYQGSGPLFIVERKAPHVARRLVLDNPATGTGVEMVTSASYDPATATLHHFGKGRGLGDCGESAAWVFDGTRFNLARYASMDACAGLLPGRWPVRWRTQEAS